GVRLEQREPRPLQRDVVVFVEVVEPDDLVPALEQTLRRMKPDDPGSSGHQYLQDASLPTKRPDEERDPTRSPDPFSTIGAAGATLGRYALPSSEPRVHDLPRQHGLDVVDEVIRCAVALDA